MLECTALRYNRLRGIPELQSPWTHPALQGRHRAVYASVLASLPHVPKVNYYKGEPALEFAQIGPQFGRIWSVVTWAQNRFIRALAVVPGELLV